MANLFELELLVKGPITEDMTTYIANMAARVLPCTPVRSAVLLPPLPTFLRMLTCHMPISNGTLFATLPLLDRLYQRLPADAHGLECTAHRILLATLIVASKVVNDTAPRNKTWARACPWFELKEINLMERQLLMLLGYDLSITESDLLPHLSPLLRFSFALPHSCTSGKKRTRHHHRSIPPSVPPPKQPLPPIPRPPRPDTWIESITPEASEEEDAGARVDTLRGRTRERRWEDTRAYITPPSPSPLSVNNSSVNLI
ncbi:uncharacterized protein VTP21DRAFT_5014 [Calcarisporiella thermophila]|uniref:uncharacterized protein n=1 Tax=Calcarisporiella thermophila TaxID=911321 RepID=UPI00374337FB